MKRKCEHCHTFLVIKQKGPGGRGKRYCSRKCYMAQRNNTLIAAALCISCGKRPRDNANRCQECATSRRVNRAIKHRERREALLNHYGRTCRCCGEGNTFFLTIDHINNDGQQEIHGP